MVLATNALPSDTYVAINPILFERGYKDGRISMMRGSLSDNLSYLQGFRTGLTFYRCSVPAVQESYLERGAHDELLNPF